MDDLGLEYLEIDTRTEVERLATSDKDAAELFRMIKRRLHELNTTAGADGRYVVSKCAPGLKKINGAIVGYDASVFFRFVPCVPLRDGIQEQFYMAKDGAQ